MASPPYRFASYDLDASIDVAKAIEDGGGVLNTHELASRLGLKNASSGTFLTRMANARLFGLVEGPGSELRASKRAIDILRPDYPATAARARLEAFEEVPLYKAVLDEYHGRILPDTAGLKNALTAKWGIEADRAGFVLIRLLESAEQAGLFSTAGDRSKMVRASSATAPTRIPAASPEQTPGKSEAARDPNSQLGTIKKFPTLIEGALEMLPPPGESWSEDQLVFWVGFFEDALRVVYKLPRRPESLATGVQRPAEGHDGSN
jgi:hypothetical protein